MIAECYASFECVVADTRFVPRYDFFVLRVVKAHVARSPRYPATLHYRGEGVFMVSGKHVNLRRRFKSDRL